MAATYEPIASTTLGSAASSVTLSGIAADWTDLVVVVTGANSEGSALGIRFNGDTSSNYSWTYIHGNGTSASSSRGSNDTRGRVGSFSTGGPHLAVVNVMNYANTSVYKTVLSNAMRDANGVYRFVSLWRNTAAITSVTVEIQYGSLQTGTTVSLYGIKAA